MTRYTQIDLSAYPVSDVLEALSFEAYLARDRAELQARWEARRFTRPDLPAFDTLFLETDPSSVILQVGSYREMLLRARVNDAIRSLTLAGAQGRPLDHIGATYFRTERRDGEDDETYRQRIALAPESWSTAGPVGAYVFWALSASPDVLDVAVYSEDEGVCLAPEVRVVVLPPAGAENVAGLLATVQDALRRSDIRPLGDLVTMTAASSIEVSLTVHLIIRSGASSAATISRARDRLIRFCEGYLRWAGDGVAGPRWLVGRTLTVETLAGVAMSGDPNILGVDVQGGDINAPSASYTQAALSLVGTRQFQPLPDEVTAHLFRAPRIIDVNVTFETAVTGWIG